MHQRDIYRFWSPLFASWLLMAVEGPLISAVINRLGDEVIMLAAQGLVMSLSVIIESPVINLLATTTTLAQDRPSYLLIRKFTLHLMILLTAITLLFSYTGLFDMVVTGWMGVPAQVSEWVRPGIRIMIVWSAAIGWRRFLQGILIRFGQTRKIAWGTAVRLVATGSSALSLALWSGWPGVSIGATSVMTGVISESLFITLVTRPVIKKELGPDCPTAQGKPLTYRDLFWFHLPLAGTSLLLLLVQPMVATSLARLDNPMLSLAAWPIVFQASLIARSPASALPEVVIALTRGRETLRPIRRFVLFLAAANTIVMALFLFTPLIDMYLLRVQDATAVVAEIAHSGLIFFLLLPALFVLISWLRGLLIKTRSTRVVNAGMFVNLAVTAAILVLGVLLKMDGIPTAAIALNSAALIELAILWRGVQPSLQEISQPPIVPVSLRF